MRVFKTLFICAFLVTTVSCGDDDEATTSVEENIVVGVWDLEALNYSGESSTAIEGTTIVQSFTGEAINIDATFTFSENPNEAVIAGSYDIFLTTTVNGQTIEQTVGSGEAGLAIDGNEPSTWSINGDQMTLVSEGETQVYTIVTLNQNTLVLNYTENVEVTQNGITTSSSLDATITMTR